VRPIREKVSSTFFPSTTARRIDMFFCERILVYLFLMSHQGFGDTS